MTPTPTETPALPPLNHFQCYEIHRPKTQISIDLTDEFGPSTVDVKKAKRICAPVDKNGEDPTAPLDPDHLTQYTIKQRSPKFEKIRNVSVTNQFGTLIVHITKPAHLLVPTSKSLTAPPDPLSPPVVDHYKCYKTAFGKFRATGIHIEDQFNTITVDIKKPQHLCVPADKNGEGILDPSAYLMCYKVHIAPGDPAATPPDLVFTNNQFGEDSFSVFGARTLCVPSTLVR